MWRYIIWGNSGAVQESAEKGARVVEAVSGLDFFRAETLFSSLLTESLISTSATSMGSGASMGLVWDILYEEEFGIRVACFHLALAGEGLGGRGRRVGMQLENKRKKVNKSSCDKQIGGVILWLNKFSKILKNGQS